MTAYALSNTVLVNQGATGSVAWPVTGSVAASLTILGNPISSGNPLPVSGSISFAAQQARNAARTAIAADVVDTLLLPQNLLRKGAFVFNDSETATLYIGLGAAEVTNDDFTVSVSINGFWEAPATFSGEIRAIWSAADGFARVTEIT